MIKVIVVGGGAAGMMAAIAAAEAGCQVVLAEKNEKLGKKIYITGKGRCNITNAGDAEDFFAHVVSNPKFLYSSFYGFTNEDMMRFLETAGLKLKTERGNRVFPLSDKSSDVIAVLAAQMKKLNVAVCLHTQVTGLITKEDAGKCICTGVRLSDGRVLDADKVIVATGGLSYPSTGSDGDGLNFAKELGHQLKSCLPALVPLTVSEPWIGQLQGLSLKNITITVYDGKKKLYQEFGEMLFTHFGVSGPCILSASSIVTEKLRKKPLVLAVDLKPALSKEQLDHRLLKEFEEIKNKQFKNALDSLLPQKMIPVMVRESGILPEKKVNEITREERQRLIDKIKNFTLILNGYRGFNEAIITQGGIKVKEVNPATMESKLISGLHFAGEVLDLDAFTGGYNLQIAWSTGYAAGKGAADEF